MIIFGIPKKKRISDEEFQTNYKQYYPIVYKNLYYLLGSNELAEDLVQEVFIQYYHTKEGEIEFVGAWLSKVAVNRAYNYLRGEKRRIKREDTMIEESNYLFTIEDEILRSEEIKRVRRILSEMTEQQRICLVMKFSGYSYDEIHQATQISRNNIGQLIARGKHKFLNLYRKEGDLNVL